MTTLQEQRDYVRLHMDLDADDLPDLLIDTWAREATTRIWKNRTRWPFMEQEWELTTEAGVRVYSLSDLSADADEITSITGDNQRLRWIGPDADEWQRLGADASGRPTTWTLWGNEIRLYPSPEGETLTVRGYAKPNDWTRKPADGSGSLAKFPDEFDNTIRLWIISAAYMQQEDTELGITYADMFNDELTKLARRYGIAPAAQSVVLGGGSSKQRHGLRYPWEV